jgi:hypothetical protein
MAAVQHCGIFSGEESGLPRAALGQAVYAHEGIEWDADSPRALVFKDSVEVREAGR